MSSPTSPHELKFWLAWHRINHIGPVRWQRLLNAFPNLETAWSATLNELIAAGIEPAIAQAIPAQRAKINPDAEYERLTATSVQCLTLADPAYPPLLRQIYGPPPLLYIRGNMDWTNRHALAVVGSRKSSSYGQQVTRQLVTELAHAGMTIVSGLAFGIDSIAHMATLSAGGATVGVLACGLDRIYPVSNRRLAHDIITAGGQLISEFPIGEEPFKAHFPRRNRTISGLCLGTLVIEATATSGALITSAAAVEQNRDVFTVPGSIFSPLSAGPHALLRQGATLVTSAQDILTALALASTTASASPKTEIKLDDPVQQQLYNLLSQQPTHVDKLVQSARLTISAVHTALTLLEIAGLITHVGGQKYVRK